jgi:DNA-binding transcriptional ArsR family regulator
MAADGLLRVHFTSEDLGRLRLARSVDWMWEVVLSLHLLQSRELQLVFDSWRRHVAASLSPALVQCMAFLNAVNPKASYFPDFLTPVNETGDLACGIDLVHSTTTAQFSVQLAELARTQALPSPVRLLAAGDKAAVAHLCSALHTYYDAAVAPFRQRINVCLAAVRSEHAQTMTTGGSEALLRSLGPYCDWQPPLLVARYPCDFDIHLDGRGLLLIPSFYCVRYPVTVFDHELSPVLVLPIPHDPRWMCGGEPRAVGGETLTDLLGDTRARILDLAENATLATGVIANKLHVSAQTISYHTKILRDAGLITSNRDGASIVHDVTAMGVALLNGRPTPV